jgi:hypothetical protein
MKRVRRPFPQSCTQKLMRASGSRVLHQVPPGSITPSPKPSKSDLAETLFPFSSVTSYLIPSQHFCDRLLTFVVNHHRIIGYPVCIQGAKYSRNEFIFNFALVIGESEVDWACYGEVVRKLGRLLRGLEEQGGFLSKEEEGVWDMDEVAQGDIGGGSKVYALCEMVLEDLNNYAECMIPIGTSRYPTRHAMLTTTHRRLKHNQPQTLPYPSSSAPHFCTPSPPPHNLSLLSAIPHILGLDSQPHPPLHQRRAQHRAHRRPRRHRSVPHAPRHPTPRVLRLPRTPRHIQLQRHIRADRGDWGLRTRPRCQR